MSSANSIIDALERAINKLPPSSSLYIALSGGMDSVVLLHCLATHHREKFSLQAIHINHKLSENAEKWQRFCQQLCLQHTIELRCKTISVDRKAKEGIEAAARQQRYHVFKQLLPLDQYLITAHHAEDQAETFLLQALRGAGIKGLAAMPTLTAFGNGKLLRPLLSVSRQQIEDYAKQHNLLWIEDESNTQEKFNRNFLRHQIMPILAQRWPNYRATLARGAKHCADADHILTEIAKDDERDCNGSQPDTLSLTKLTTLSFARCKNLVRYWIHRQGFILPNENRLNEILWQLLSAASNSNPQIRWQNTIVQRFHNDLYVMEILPDVDNATSTPWHLSQPLSLPHGDTLHATQVMGKGINIAKLSSSLVDIRFRCGGEKCRPQGRIGSHPLKKLLQEWQVPPWLRNRVPLVYYQDELIAVANYCVVESFAAVNNELGWQITWQIQA